MHGKGITRTLFVFTLVGLVLFALGGVAMAAPPTTIGDVGQSGPIPPNAPKLGDPVGVQHEVQWVTVTITSIPASGTYTLAGSGSIPVVPPVVNPQNTVRDALNLVFGASSMTVVGGPTSVDYAASGALTGGTDGAYYYRVMWTGGASASSDVPTMAVNAAAAVGATVTVDPYRDGQTLTGRVQPHGGYSGTTDYCLQCHTVHNAPGAGYSLLADNSVTATCKTCHTIGVAISGLNPPADMTAINPGFPGVEAPTSERGSYEVTGGAELAAHTLGASAAGTPYSTITQINDAGWAYSGFNAAGWTANQGPAGPGTVSDTTGGLYCGSCHTPHGDFGRLVNSENGGFRTTADGDNLNDVDAWAEGAPIYAGRNLRYLHLDVSTNAAGEKAWTACLAAGPAVVANALDTGCSYLTAADTEGESAYTYGYKLLSAYPNHTWTQGPESWGMDASNHDGARWCGRCHDEATPSEYGGTFHNHPTGCTACHGNPNDGTSTDFPHTSTFQDLLKDYPDLLCINCHTAGSLP